MAQLNLCFRKLVKTPLVWNVPGILLCSSDVSECITVFSPYCQQVLLCRCIRLPHEIIALDSDAFISVCNEFHNIFLYGKDPSLLEYDPVQHFNLCFVA